MLRFEILIYSLILWVTAFSLSFSSVTRAATNEVLTTSPQKSTRPLTATRAFCQAPELNWAILFTFEKIDPEAGFVSQVDMIYDTHVEASYRIAAAKVPQYPDIGFDSYRAVFGDELSTFVINVPRATQGKSTEARAYLTTDGETQDLACQVTLKTPDNAQNIFEKDIQQRREEAKISVSDLPPQVCALEYYNQIHEAYEFGCSATIVSHSDLLTASHCQMIYHDRPARALCPGHAPIEIDLAHSLRHELHVKDKWRVAYDIALLRLKTPIDTDPVEIALSDDEVRHDIFQTTESCALFGYGRQVNGTMGVLHGSKLELPPMELGGRAFSEKNFDEEGMVSSDPNLFLRSGDSGGPILCRNSDGENVLVAVHSILFALDSSANSSSIGHNAEWVAAHISVDADNDDQSSGQPPANGLVPTSEAPPLVVAPTPEAKNAINPTALQTPQR